MLKIQEALDLIIEHYIDELREARRGGGHAIPDRYALTILEDTEAIRNYVKPVLADRIRELDEQVPKIRIEDLAGEIEGKEGKISPVWHTEKPTEDGTFLVLWKDTEEPIRRYSVLHWNEYNDTWYDEETSYCNWGDEDHAEVIAWQRIEPYKEEEK